MLVNLSSVAYTAVCGLVRDALEDESDAKELLMRTAHELASARSDMVAVAVDTLAHGDATHGATTRGIRGS